MHPPSLAVPLQTLLPPLLTPLLPTPPVAGMGEADDPLFLGFGGHRLAVSRQLACTPMNVGSGDVADDPLPCVLDPTRTTIPCVLRLQFDAIPSRPGLLSLLGLFSPTLLLCLQPHHPPSRPTSHHCLSSACSHCPHCPPYHRQAWRASLQAHSPTACSSTSLPPSTMMTAPCQAEHSTSPSLLPPPPPPPLPVFFLTVLPSTGDDAAGQVNASDSTTTSSTALFPTSDPTPTFNPTSNPNPKPTPPSTTTPSSSSASLVYLCAPGCGLQRLANGVCDAPCNTRACAFDGGDCACVDPLFGPGICACPPAHTRRDDGSVGTNLNFPFSLQRYGPNYTETNHAFAAERDTAANRFVSHHNRLLIGMVLQQDRWGTEVCTGQGVLHLGGWCSNGPSSEPFGVNPHFLPTSPIYDSAASANMTQLDNSTFGSKLLFNPQGLPYGFIYPVDELQHFPLVFDINLDNDAATRRLHYLMEGGYIDNSTRSVDVTFITFNGTKPLFLQQQQQQQQQQRLCFLWRSACVHCTATHSSCGACSAPIAPLLRGAHVRADHSNLHREHGRADRRDDKVAASGDAHVAAAREMMDHVHMEGSVLGYFGLVWNWVDLFSLALQFTAIVIWLVLWRAVESFDMQPRYNIYYSLLEMPRYWAVPNPPMGFLLAGQAFLDLRYIINMRAVYFALQGINLFLMMVRLLKLMVFHPYLGSVEVPRNENAPPPAVLTYPTHPLPSPSLFLMMVRLLKFMDFQPYLGVITRSLALATPSLLHFFLLSFAVFFCFSMYAYLVFGGALEQVCGCDEEQFSTILTSMFSCFLLLLNDNSSAYFFQRLESWDLIAAMLFFLMFIVLMVFILLNFLIAIIVDAFMSVKDSNVVATSITSDVAHIVKYKWNCWCGRYMPYSRLLRHLVNLGAKDTRVDDADRRMRRYKSIQRRVGSVFSSRVGSGHTASSSHFTRAADSHPAFPAAAVPRVRKQHVLTVKDKRIDEISLSIILQRRLDRERARGHQSASMKPLDPVHSAVVFSSVGSGTGAHDTGMEELSQALVLQCGEVVKQSALPVKKPVLKLSLAHIQEEVVRSQQAVEEVRGMVVELQSEASPTHSTLRQQSPEHGLCQKRLSAESRDEGDDGTAGDEGAVGDLQQAVGSSGGARIGCLGGGFFQSVRHHMFHLMRK
ncbi:unnamed protein product [Closterium sp. Naga37s-1]|nr:unnamed protein product [Closterium sp. Naga37s-1]